MAAVNLKERIKEFLSVRYGSGDGSGSGSGYGDGYGSGDGYGYGYGYGDGYGDGSGYGYGDGYGYGVKTLNGEDIHRIDGVQTIIRSVKGNVVKGAILNSDLTLSPCFVVKQDNLFAHGSTLKEAMTALRDKLFEDMSEDERIAMFLKETEPGKKYPARYFYDWHHRLTGSCDMGRASFARDHGIDVDTYELDLAEFFGLTRDTYGGNVIRKAEKEANNK